MCSSNFFITQTGTWPQRTKNQVRMNSKPITRKGDQKYIEFVIVSHRTQRQLKVQKLFYSQSFVILTFLQMQSTVKHFEHWTRIRAEGY